MTRFKSILILAAAACSGKSSKAAGDSASTSTYSSAPRVTSPAAKPACPATGEWAVCSVEQRLKRAGMVARRIEAEAPARAAFSIAPRSYTIGRDSRLELFFYPSEAALKKDLSGMDTVRVAPKNGRGSWPVPPVLIHSANLAAVLVTRDPREADRVSLALTAGPPQRSK